MRWCIFRTGHQATDLAADPKHQAKLAELRKKMNAKMKGIGDEFKKCSWYRDNWTKDRVIIKGGQGTFKRDLGPTIEIDTDYSGVQ